jgi:N-methylhydantoinase A
MEKAIRVVSIERGYDPRDYVLVAFGGAGGLHACDLAGALGMQGALIPRLPGGLSALGILRADIVKDLSQTVNLAVASPREASARLEQSFAKLLREGMREMSREGVPAGRIKAERWLDVRYCGQAYSLNVPAHGDFVAAFHRAHEQRHGYHDRTRRVEVVNVRCRFIGVTDKPKLPRMARAKPGEAPRPLERVRCGFGEKFLPAGLYQREDLRAGHQVRGPAVVAEYSATTLVPPGWKLRVDAFGNLLLSGRKLRG